MSDNYKFSGRDQLTGGLHVRLDVKFGRILKKKQYFHDPVVVLKWKRLGVRVLQFVKRQLLTRASMLALKIGFLDIACVPFSR